MDAVNLAIFYFVRHAKAGSRSHWSADDRQRPLSKKGFKQAKELVAVLEKFPIKAIYSSPFLRCVQTVEPLARARDLEVNQSAALEEGKGLHGVMQLIRDPKVDGSVLGCHGDLVWELVEDLVKRHVIHAGDGGFDKGSTWVVSFDEVIPVKARYIPPP